MFTTANGKQYQMYSFGGSEVYAIKKQYNEERTELCLELAQYLTSVEAQEKMYGLIGVQPSKTTVINSSMIQSNETLVAYYEQMRYAEKQPSMPEFFWNNLSANPDNIPDEDVYDFLIWYEELCEIK